MENALYNLRRKKVNKPIKKDKKQQHKKDKSAPYSTPQK